MYKNNELLVSKQITSMPKNKLNINAKKIFYIILKEKIKQFFNECEYDSSWVFDWDNVDKKEIIKDEIKFNMSMLKKIFKGHRTFEEISNYVLDIDYELTIESLYQDSKRELPSRVIEKDSLIKVRVYTDYKEIGFIIREEMIPHICDLRKFAKIDINDLINLKTDYQIRFYEFICENNYIDSNGNKLINDNMRKVPIEKFVKYFNIKDGYKTNDIETKIIKPALSGITKNTKYNASFVKFKINDSDKKRISHYRIDVELKEKV